MLSRSRAESQHRVVLGFTLIELMAALLLLSFIFLLLTNGLQFGTTVWNGRSDRGGSETQSFLRRLISEARPVMIQAGANHALRVFFFGQEASLHFVTSLPDHLGVGGFYDVKITLVDGSASGHVQLDWRVFRASDVSLESGYEKQIELLSDVQEFQLSYFGRLAIDQPAQWHSSWSNLDHLPELIRVRVVFADHSHAWPDLVEAPVIRSLNRITSD